MCDMPPSVNKDDNMGKEECDSLSEDSDWDLPLCFDEPRHLEAIKGAERVDHTWRLKEKYKTHCVALVLCLNIGVDPPDVVKTQPCSRLECWIDPQSLSPAKALETIGHALQVQYERWQPRARYKQSLDPTSEEVKKLCTSLRRNAKDERVLFHYNGHGVPRPTTQGEIWVFNKAFTQYIPLSMYDLQTWMGSPSLYVYDCSNAGVIVDKFKQFAEQHVRDYQLSGNPAPTAQSSLQLGACAAGQSLPQHPELPADLFTACLTTPVKMAVKWFALTQRTRVCPPDIHDLVDKIPGLVSDRRTMLGELNWIFTAITDTIAWNSLPAELFQQLFRADLLTASLCRNYLLADRIMRSYNCTPVSSPALPSLATHPLWQAWDQTLDLALAQLPGLLAGGDNHYRQSPFFREQLTAFQVWLDLGKWSPQRPPPDQLPMLLQVLLSTLHRVRALQILCRFLALGSWAVRAVLAVGIFPYMLRLLLASEDLRRSMVYIWAKIIAVDPSCQADLVNANAHKYFLAVLADPTVDTEHRTLAAYVLAGIVDNYPAGQEAALQGGLISTCLEQLRQAAESGGDARLLRWLCVCVGRLWQHYDAAKWCGVRDLAHEKLFPLLRHEHAEVRASVAFALGTFVQRLSHAGTLEQQVALELAAAVTHDASHIVRQEILAALQWLVLTFEHRFVAVSLQEKMKKSERQRRRSRVDPGQEALERGAGETPRKSSPVASHLAAIGYSSVYVKLWNTLTALGVDPHPAVSAMAADLVRHVERQPERPGAVCSSLPPSPNARDTHVYAHARTLPAHGHRRETDDPGDSTSDSGAGGKRAIVRTEFVSWLSAELTRGGTERGGDQESVAHQERRWRYRRNRSLRRAAAATGATHVTRLDCQAFTARSPLPPAVVLFHPYDQHLAVASKDNYGIWDWGTGAKLGVGGWRRAAGRITSLALANAHERPLLMAASHSGALAVYPLAGEPRPLAAWRALDVHAYTRPPPSAKPIYSLAQRVSEQFMSSSDERSGANPGLDGSSQSGDGCGSPPPATLVDWCGTRCTAVVAGNAPMLRFWDLRAELRTLDINTETEAACTAICRLDDVVTCGFADGAIRSWDDRAPQRPTRVLQAAVEPASVLCCVARRHDNTLVTVTAAGGVCVFDERCGASAASAWRCPTLSAAAVHPLAGLVACGLTNQSVNVYDLKGTPLNTIKFHEGFMGSRIGPVSCLAFHPLRCALSVGTRDSCVSVYVSEPRR